MICKNCGSPINEGDKFCSYCGTKVENQINIVNNDENVTQKVQDINNNSNENQKINTTSNVESQINDINFTNKSDINNNQQQKSHKPNKLIKILSIIGGVVVVFIILFIIIFAINYVGLKKLVCKSNQGNITIMYKKSGIKSYTSNEIIYDLDAQNEYAKLIGMDAYIIEFNNWFTANTSGSCTIDGKLVGR